MRRKSSSRGVGSKFGLVRQILCQSSQHSVQVHCMRSMQMLGGSGGMPPQEMDALRLNLVAFLTLQYNVHD